MLNEREWAYQPATVEAAPKYAAIRLAEAEVGAMVRWLRGGGEPPSHDAINACVLRYALVIDELAPDSDDKTAAIRCCRLVRNALNEARALRDGARDVGWLLDLAEAEAIKARWQASAAIAFVSLYLTPGDEG